MHNDQKRKLKRKIMALKKASYEYGEAVNSQIDYGKCKYVQACKVIMDDLVIEINSLIDDFGYNCNHNMCESDATDKL